MRSIFKFNFILVALLLIFLTPSLSNAVTYYVDDDTGNDAWTGSAESPFATIQKAVDTANTTGDEIRVAEGTYTGTSAVDPDGSGETYYQVVFIRNKTLTLRGGYDTSDWFTSDPETNATTIDAQGYGRGITIRNSISTHAVTIDGFTITGGDYSDLGNADGVSNSECSRTGSDCGGGLYANYATLILKNSVITENNAGSTNSPSDGGGIYLYIIQPASLMDNVTVSNNTALTNSSEGGGLQVQGGWDASINDCTFSNNHSQNGGAVGIFHPNGTVNIEDTFFSGNTCFYNGGALSAKLTYGGETALYINRVTIYDNEGKAGAGIYLDKHGSNPTNVYMNNLILAGNTSSDTGDENSLIFVTGGDDFNILINHLTAANNSATSFLYTTTYASAGMTISASVNNTIVDSFAYAFGGNETYGSTVYDGDVVINYNNVLIKITSNITHNFGGTPSFSGSGTINADPLLDTTYHLRPGSPAINAGINTGITTDIDGDERPNGSGYDIGADEFYAKTLAGILLLLFN